MNNDSRQNLIALMQASFSAARCGDYGAAASLWGRVTLHLEEYLNSLEMSSTGDSQDELSRKKQKFISSLTKILKYQENSDWVAFADVVEFELLTLLIV